MTPTDWALMARAYVFDPVLLAWKRVCDPYGRGPCRDCEFGFVVHEVLPGPEYPYGCESTPMCLFPTTVTCILGRPWFDRRTGPCPSYVWSTDELTGDGEYIPRPSCNDWFDLLGMAGWCRSVGTDRLYDRTTSTWGPVVHRDLDGHTWDLSAGMEAMGS